MHYYRLRLYDNELGIRDVKKKLRVLVGPGRPEGPPVKGELYFNWIVHYNKQLKRHTILFAKQHDFLIAQLAF